MQARKPVLYVGGGCLDASAELREFVQRTGVPVAATLMGLGTFPEDHELALQVGKTLPWHPVLAQLWPLSCSVKGLGCSVRVLGLLLPCHTAMWGHSNRHGRAAQHECSSWVCLCRVPGMSSPQYCCTAPLPSR